MTKTVIILLIGVFSGTIGDLLLSRAMRTLHLEFPAHWNNLPIFFYKAFQSGILWLGILFLAGFFFLYLIALSRADVSFVLPLTAISYILTALFARIFLDENVNWVRWTGTLLIFIGVVFIAISYKYKYPEKKQPDLVITESRHVE